MLRHPCLPGASWPPCGKGQAGQEVPSPLKVLSQEPDSAGGLSGLAGRGGARTGAGAWDGVHMHLTITLKSIS